MRTVPVLLLLAATACATSEQPTLGPDDGFDDTKVDGGKADDARTRRTVHTFSDHRLFPEGGAFDPVERAFYVGSIEHGTVTEVDAQGRESTFFAGTGEDERYTLGMQVDAERRLLWVCTTKDSLGSVWIFDLASHAWLYSIDLTVANPKASCNDLLLDGDGALVSDRENSHIYWIDGARRVSVWAHDPLLEGTLVSLNGMVFTPDHSAVLTATYLEPRLVRVSTSNPRDVREVDLDGDFFMDGFNVLNGPDDLMMMPDGQLIVAFGSSIKRVTPSTSTWHEATVRSTRSIGGVTALVTDGETLWGVNGQSVRYLLHVPPSPFEIFEIDPAKLR
jgi:sugar lactone lactonase YvrE